MQDKLNYIGAQLDNLAHNIEKGNLKLFQQVQQCNFVNSEIKKVLIVANSENDYYAQKWLNKAFKQLEGIKRNAIAEINERAKN